MPKNMEDYVRNVQVKVRWPPFTICKVRGKSHWGLEWEQLSVYSAFTIKQTSSITCRENIKQCHTQILNSVTPTAHRNLSSPAHGYLDHYGRKEEYKMEVASLFLHISLLQYKTLINIDPVSGFRFVLRE